MKNLNWYELRAAAFTAIRINFPVWELEQMARAGNETPVSGDALIQRKAIL